MPGDHPSEKRFTFTRDMRLRTAGEFTRVYEASVRVNAGPLLVYAAPNCLPHSRLGLAIARRVGNAVIRNAVKRRLREAFRLHQHELPHAPGGAGYDFVFSAKPHDPLPLNRYRTLLAEAAEQLHQKWDKKRLKTE